MCGGACIWWWLHEMQYVVGDSGMYVAMVVMGV